ncbi:methyltransferase domain-containing protein [Candidatus Woesebacteria bacterium]|nr:methyltransferase domain-containing protein [Candidatus Woesebacteria bacterium]
MENDFDCDHINNERSKIFREVFDKISIKSDQELAIALQDYSVAYFEKGGNEKVIWKNVPLMRAYLINKTFSWLQMDSPQNLLECGSAGDISAAISLPNTEVTSYDIDPDIFFNVPYNDLPEEYLGAIGKKKNLEGYGPKDLLGFRRRKLDLVKEALPNWKMEVGDANEIKHPDNSFEAVLVQGTPNMLDFIDEMARVVEPGGFVVSIIHEEIRIGEYESVYKTGRYNTLPEYQFVDSGKLEELGLEKVEIPQEFKEYENLCEWGKNKSSGFVFEVFKKNQPQPFG